MISLIQMTTIVLLPGGNVCPIGLMTESSYLAAYQSDCCHLSAKKLGERHDRIRK
jgi:hypothetical protein